MDGLDSRMKAYSRRYRRSLYRCLSQINYCIVYVDWLLQLRLSEVTAFTKQAEVHCRDQIKHRSLNRL